MQRAYRRTEGSNRSPTLLPAALQRAPPPVRGSAGLLRRGATLGQGGTCLRLQRRFLSRPLPPLPARPRPAVLSLAKRRSASPAKEERGARAARLPAKAELLRLRDQ